MTLGLSKEGKSHRIAGKEEGARPYMLPSKAALLLTFSRKMRLLLMADVPFVTLLMLPIASWWRQVRLWCAGVSGTRASLEFTRAEH